MQRPTRFALGIILAAACSAAPRGAAAATDDGAAPASPFQLQPAADSSTVFLPAGTPVYADESAASEGTLMRGLDQVGVGQTLSKLGINVFGWVEGSYNYNFSNPHSRVNLDFFDVKDSEFQLNQLNLSIERKVTLSSKQFDIGGRVDLLYGSDAEFIHSNGLLDHQTGPNQFDIPQIYADVALPVGDGLRLRVGKFEFFKLTDPNASPLFSHTWFYSTGGQNPVPPKTISTLEGAALPFTETGVTGYYEFSKQLNVEAGFGRGFDESSKDNNGAIDGFGRVGYAISDKTRMSFALVTGPEINQDNSHYRTTGDLSVAHSVSDDLLILAEGEYGVQARSANFPAFVAPGVVGTSSGDAHYYGLNATAVYTINKNLSVAGRVEWYRDEQGFTTGFSAFGKGGLNLYEVTLGLTITPLPDDAVGSGLKIRPEIRYDFSDKNYFDTGTANDQWIAAVDAIFNF
jgi:hypothetical protein